MLPVATNLQLQANLPRSLLFFFAENIPAGLHCIFSIKKKSIQTNQSREELIQPSSSSPCTVSIHSFHQLATSALAGSGKEDTPKIMLFSANLNMISWYAPLVIYYPTCDPPSFINGKASTLLARIASLLSSESAQPKILPNSCSCISPLVRCPGPSPCRWILKYCPPLFDPGSRVHNIFSCRGTAAYEIRSSLQSP